ncbi:putative oxidoreductase [Hypoxylon sp. EC38]|nr:putative oxidoreductase [Hypoxylon sp. EC38]
MVDSTTLGLSEALIALLGADKVHLPDSTGYNETLSSYFSPQAAAVRPACFVTPQTVADVSAAVKFLTSSDNCGPYNFAVRAGSHMWFAGANNTPNGVTIDLSGLDSANLSSDKSTLSVDAGATWDAVYSKLDPLGLSVAGGRVGDVGVAGLTLGGGISYFGPREGWTCNQVTSFEVVLADGSVVEANEKQNADLWWGLRGGSNNFGIVTRITFKTFEQGLLWSTLTLNPLTENYDVNASFIAGWVFASDQGLFVALNQLVYTRAAEDEIPALYKPILDLSTIPNPAATTVITNMSTLARNSAAIQRQQAARYTYNAFNASLSLLEDVTGIMWAVNIEPLPPQIYTRGGADTNALGLSKHTGSLAVCLVSPSWSDAAHDNQVYSTARSLMADIEAKAKKLGVYDPYIYLNYAAPWQDVIMGYGEESVEKLQKLRKRVDPRGEATARYQSVALSRE